MADMDAALGLPMSQEDYAACNGKHCPNCRSDDLDHESSGSYDDGYIRFHMACFNCGFVHERRHQYALDGETWIREGTCRDQCEPDEDSFPQLVERDGKLTFRVSCGSCDGRWQETIVGPPTYTDLEDFSIGHHRNPRPHRPQL